MPILVVTDNTTARSLEVTCGLSLLPVYTTISLKNVPKVCQEKTKQFLTYAMFINRVECCLAFSHFPYPSLF